MKKYTQADFDGFEVDEWDYKICPSGDYTAITSFGDGCRFGVVCIFSDGCSFDAECCFGTGCHFGARCNFGAWCNFGSGCSFGAKCSFGDLCKIDDGCRFGAECSFGELCRFGEWCRFGEGCSFEDGAVKNGRYVAVDGIGRTGRKAYLFIDENGKMFVRVGPWFSDMNAFKERVKEVHAGTVHEKTYLMACDLAEMMLKIEDQESPDF